MSVQALQALWSTLSAGDWRLVNVTVAVRSPAPVGVSDVSVMRESAVVAYPESKDASGWSALPWAVWELAYSA